ncbi:hypothetical protein BDU57DRAFT_521569 [Ampelomyces quisqualis]|uniref:Uncharacterized protein n=1 Tax=Ampelomyces quisqualis TaxID=50730 RepID=A0A6A5QC93_AMPQU|nr:hypothetical protein BDU57DRAFT_521569 [Ampelomyces quisqualis]
MHYTSFTITALVAIAPMAYAQLPSTTSAPDMMPTATPSQPAITMAWNSEPSAALSATDPSARRSTAMEDVMTMSDGSVMTMPAGMPMSRMSGMSATGAGMAGMNFTGAAEGINVRRGSWGTGAGMMFCLGAGSVLLNMVV